MAKKKTSCNIPMRKGQSKTITAHGEELVVRRTGGRSWFMKISGTNEHARWADTKSEACEDIQHFRETGALPRGKRMW